MNARYTCYIAMLALLLLLNATHTVFASETAWEEIAPGAQLRMISSNKSTKPGHIDAAIQVRMAPGLITYWRIPGETGIPLQANWEGSQNISMATLHWPMPKRSHDYGVMDYIYEGDLTIPIDFELENSNENALLSATLNLGICSDICVPVRWSGELEIDQTRPSSGNAFRIQAAFAHIPILDERPNAPFARLGYVQELDLLITAPAEDLQSNSSLILDLPKTTLLFDVPHSDLGSGLLSIASLVDFDLSTLVGRQINLTYDSEDGPYAKLVLVENARLINGELTFD